MLHGSQVDVSADLSSKFQNTPRSLQPSRLSPLRISVPSLSESCSSYQNDLCLMLIRAVSRNEHAPALSSARIHISCIMMATSTARLCRVGYTCQVASPRSDMHLYPLRGCLCHSSRLRGPSAWGLERSSKLARSDVLRPNILGTGFCLFPTRYGCADSAELCPKLKKLADPGQPIVPSTP